TAPPSPAIVVVVDGLTGVADTTDGNAMVPTDSAPTPTTSAATRTVNFTSSRLAGPLPRSRGAHAGVSRTSATNVAPLEILNFLMPPASARSWRHASMAATASGGPLTSSSSTDARWLNLASVFARRTKASTSLIGPSMAASPLTSSASVAGHDSLWTEVSCHQLHTSSETNGRNGAKSFNTTSRAWRSAA